jgi:hypothetical protein
LFARGLELKAPYAHIGGQLPVRYNGYRLIWSALHKVFVTGTNTEEVWTQIKSAPSSDDGRHVCKNCYGRSNYGDSVVLFRNDFLLVAAKGVEFSAHSLSTTPEWYNRRVLSLLDGSKMLTRREAWNNNCDEYDDARDIIAILQDVNVGRKGKRKDKAH